MSGAEGEELTPTSRYSSRFSGSTYRHWSFFTGGRCGVTEKERMRIEEGRGSKREKEREEKGRERERKKERERESEKERKRERKRESKRDRKIERESEGERARETAVEILAKLKYRII